MEEDVLGALLGASELVDVSGDERPWR